MKKFLSVAVVCVLTVLVLGACSSNPDVRRVNSDSQIDVSGYWNDVDVRIVCDSLIKDCLNSPEVSRFIQQYSASHEGRLPAVIVGTFKNESSEHIDTGIISTIMERTIMNTGRLTFVADRDSRQEIREERQDQQIYSSAATTSALSSETGAALMLTGTVRSIVDRISNRTVRSYFVSAELTSIESTERLWIGLNDEIKKDIRQSGARP